SIQCDAGRFTCQQSIRLGERGGQKWIGEKGRLLWRHIDVEAPGGRAKQARGVKWNQAVSTLPDAGESGFVPPRNLVSKVIIRLLFFYRAAKRRAGLHASVGRIRHVAEGIHRLEVAVANVPVHIAVEFVRTGPRNDVDHATRRSSIFRRVAVGDDLELL